MKRLTIDFMVGLFVLLGVLSLVFLSFRVATQSDLLGSNNEIYTLNANFDNIGSLKSNAPVKAAGFIVGRINSITLNPKSYQVQVHMEINKKYKFSKDTAAQILTTGLLGEQYIALQSGADPEYLKDGDTISLTSSALVLENLIGKFMTNSLSK